MCCGRGLWWLGMRGLPWEGEGGGVECFEERVADWLFLGGEGRPAKGPWQDCRFQLGSVVSRDECRRTAAICSLLWYIMLGAKQARSRRVLSGSLVSDGGSDMHKTPRPAKIHSRGCRGKGTGGGGERARQPRRGGIGPLTHSVRHGEEKVRCGLDNAHGEAGIARTSWVL